MDYYIALGVAQDASQEAIRTAFRTLARQYHPDAGAGSSVEAFRYLVEAYETLSDPTRRRRYDQAWRATDRPVATAIEPRTAPNVPERWEAPRGQSRYAIPFSAARPHKTAFDDLFGDVVEAMEVWLRQHVRREQ